MGKSQRTYWMTYNEDNRDLERRQDRIARLGNYHGLKHSPLNCLIFDTGIDVLEELMDNETGIDNQQRIGTVIKRIRDKNRLLLDLEEIYEAKGIDEFREICRNEKIDGSIIDEFLEKYTWKSENLQWSKRAHIWLTDLFEDKDEIVTSEIRKAGLEDGFIENDSDWNKLRNFASRRGWTNSSTYGMWKRP